MKPIVTLTTDFGVDSHYTAIMRGVMLSISPELYLVDISHRIPPQDVRQAAWILDQVAWSFPRGTVHLVVVDPGVGTDRACVAAEIDGRRFVAPDNGVLSLVCRRASPDWCVRLENPRYRGAEISATFHGRDIMAPAAAHLAVGIEPQELGPTHCLQSTIRWPEPEVTPEGIRGEIVTVDPFGNLVTNILGTQLPPPARLTGFLVGDREVKHFVHTYAEASPGMLVALIGSHGFLEIAQVDGDAAATLGVRPGVEVFVSCRR
ncbi:hypothetical protein JCM19992_13000 [Thermostilla marina]